MNIEGFKANKIQFLIILLMFLGIVASVILVQRQQILKSRAQEIFNAFEITDNSGNPLQCSQDTCQTQSLDVQIKIRDLESLISD